MSLTVEKVMKEEVKKANSSVAVFEGVGVRRSGVEIVSKSNPRVAVVSEELKIVNSSVVEEKEVSKSVVETVKSYMYCHQILMCQ